MTHSCLQLFLKQTRCNLGKLCDFYAGSSTAHVESLHLQLDEAKVNLQETVDEFENRLGFGNQI